VRVLFSDAVATARSMPTVSRAALTASRAAQRQQNEPAAESDEPIDVPTATTYVDADAWDRRAEELDVSPATLVAALAADVARRLGRTDDGTVDLRLAVNERVSSDDTRANAKDNVDVPLGPDADLAILRADIRLALRRHRKVHDPRAEFVPLPPRVIRKAPVVAFGGVHKVVSDDLGEAHPILRRPDGTEADTVYVRTLFPGVTKATLHRIGGVLTLTFGRSADRAFISVAGYQPGRENAHQTLHRIITDALAGLGLSGAAIKEVATC
jgi:diacylglycerol O-acyltransferase / wax synthase